MAYDLEARYSKSEDSPTLPGVSLTWQKIKNLKSVKNLGQLTENKVLQTKNYSI